MQDCSYTYDAISRKNPCADRSNMYILLMAMNQSVSFSYSIYSKTFKGYIPLGDDCKLGKKGTMDVSEKCTKGYRYGFNGKERDDEANGVGNCYDYGFRIYNPRLGRFLSVDPLTKNFAMLTPYQFAANTPIRAIDLDGLEAVEVGKNNPFLVIVVLGRNGGMYSDDIEGGNTQYQNLPPEKQNDDGLSLLGQLPTGATVVTFTGSDDDKTTNDIHQTIKNYRTTNPEGKIVIVGHSLGGVNAMDAALKVEKDNTIANKTIDLVITMEPTSVANRGTPIVRELGNNVKSIINYTAFSSSFQGGGAEGGSGNVGNFTLGKGTDHTNMDNTLLPAVGAILKTLNKGIDPVKAAGAIDYNKLKTYSNGSRDPKATGGSSSGTN